METVTNLMKNVPITTANTAYQRIHQLVNPQRSMENVSNSNSSSVVIEKIEAPVMVTKELTEADVKKHSRLIGEISSKGIREGLGRRGVRSLSGLALQPT